ncbi:MAG: polyprenyl synthetase family protein [Rhodospirillales bacterium]|nr:polyprenyl synthetase family protein [Rhodospirillales bacterium]
MTPLKKALAETASAMDEILDSLNPESQDAEARLIEAMRYSSLDGGKRLRPFLVVQSAKLFNVSERSALRVAAAIEMIHCYSLIHDDLPAMDDDDLRRGRPSNHKKFDEATAILAGDALLTQAFEILAHEDTHDDPAVRCQLVSALAQAAGRHGMVGGQMIDLVSEDHELSMDEITRLQRLKTGCLFGFACEAGAILGKAPLQVKQALHNYAHDFGLAFQISDDLLDVVGDEKEVGKTLGKDAEAGKATFVSLMGLDRARSQAQMLADQACDHVSIFKEKADLLQDLARYVVERSA